MSPEINVFINDKGKPTNIPTYESIIRQSFELRPSQVTAINISGVRLSLDKSSETDVSNVWVKFGSTVNMGEARTQDFVSRYLEEHNITAVRAPRVYLAFTLADSFFIVSEFIDGPMCDYSDLDLIAAAVQALIEIPSPSTTPGPVGGGVIEHPFFVDRESDIWYDRVEELEDHVNGILATTKRPGRVDFANELVNGLLLCVLNLNPVNFMKDKEGRTVAVDYGGYSFLPPSFFALALARGAFAHPMLKSPTLAATNIAALTTASYALVPYSSNAVGLPKKLKSRRLW